MKWKTGLRFRFISLFTLALLNTVLPEKRGINQFKGLNVPPSPEEKWSDRNIVIWRSGLGSCTEMRRPGLPGLRKTQNEAKEQRFNFILVSLCIRVTYLLHCNPKKNHYKVHRWLLVLQGHQTDYISQVCRLCACPKKGTEAQGY